MEAETALDGRMSVLVLSKHEAVRRQLVAHLARSPQLAVTGASDGRMAIAEVHPRIVVLDLSGLDPMTLARFIALADESDVRLIALASVHDPRQEGQIVAAGGAYLLKAVGAGCLDAVLEMSAAAV